MSALLIALGILVALVVALRVRSLIRPEPFPPWMTPMLEGRLRRLFFDRERTLQRIGLGSGMRALEVGPGGGYLTERAVEVLGPKGTLVCLDLQIEMLRKVRKRLGTRAPLLVCASGSSLPLRDGAFDLAFLVSVLGEIPDRRAAMQEYARILRPGGTLAVTEGLPDPDYVRTPVLRRLAADAGLEAGPRNGTWVHYTHRFARP